MSTATKNQGYEGKDIDSTLVEPFDPQRFADMVQTAVRANTVMRDVAMTVNRELVGSPGSAIDIRQTGRVAVNDKTEGSATADEDYPHESTTVTTDPSQSGGFVKQTIVPITDEAQEDSNLDELERTATNIGESMAEANDSEAYNIVTGLAAGGSSPAAGEAYSATTSSAGEISYTDVKDLAMTMQQNKYRVDSLLVSFDHASDLLDEDKFILANEAGTDAGLREGRVGRFAGLEVYVSSQFNASSGNTGDIQAVVLDSDRAYAEAVKREPTIEEDRLPQQGETDLVGTFRFGMATVDENAIGYLVNA